MDMIQFVYIQLRSAAELMDLL